MLGLHPFAGRIDDRVGRGDDVRRGAVIVRQKDGFGPVVRLETSDELHRGAGEPIDVLIVVPHGEQAEFVVFVGEGAARQRRDQGVLFGADVLIFVHEDPAEPRQQTCPVLVRIVRRQPFAAQHIHGLAQHRVERIVVQPLGAAAETGADQAHGESVTRQDRDALGVVADQGGETAADLGRGVPVVGQRDDAAWLFAAHPHQVGDPVHQHPRLARTGAGQYQDVRPLPVVGHDALLDGVPQILDDVPPRCGRGLAGEVPAVRQPAAQEVFLLQAEIVHRQTVRFSRVLQAALRILGHDVNLSHLILVMKFERLEVRGAEVAPLPTQADGHGRAEHRQPLVQTNDLLVVQPE